MAADVFVNPDVFKQGVLYAGEQLYKGSAAAVKNVASFLGYVSGLENIVGFSQAKALAAVTSDERTRDGLAMVMRNFAIGGIGKVAPYAWVAGLFYFGPINTPYALALSPVVGLPLVTSLLAGVGYSFFASNSLNELKAEMSGKQPQQGAFSA